MFKTTPRSNLLGKDLIRKSATRVFIDEDGNIQHFDDTILDEHIDSYEHTDGKRIDRAPFGRQEDGNSHMIDALLEHMMRLAIKNGFSPDQVIGKTASGDFTLRDAGIHAINVMIANHNKDRSSDKANHLPHFGDSSWRKLVAGNWFGEPKEGQVLNHAAEGAGSREIYNSVTREMEDTPHMITVTLKKDSVRHNYSDKGQYIDAGYNPLYDYVEPVVNFMNQYYKDIMNITPEELGPFHDPGANFMRDFTQPSVKPSAMTGGRVHAIRTKDFDAMLRENRLGKEYAERVELYSGQPYLSTEANAPAHIVTHGGVHYPSEMLIPDRQGRPSSSFNRANVIRNFLQNVANAGGEDAQAAIEILQRDNEADGAMLNQLQQAPALTHFFGGGGSKAASRGKKGFGINRMTGRPHYLSRVASELGITPESINNVHASISPRLPERLPVGKQTKKIIHNLHALHAARTNQLASEGVENPAAVAAEEIRMHGMDKLTPQQQQQADTTRQITNMFAAYHGLENPIQGAMEAPQYDTSRLYNQSTPESPTLANISYVRDGPEEIEKSFNSQPPDIVQIQKSFETLQMSSAYKDLEVIPYVKKGYSLDSYNDVRSFATFIGLTSQDIQGIMATKGDWGVIAKQWNVSPTIVKATKLTFGGV